MEIGQNGKAGHTETKWDKTDIFRQNFKVGQNRKWDKRDKVGQN